MASPATLMDYLAGDALTKLATAYAVKPGLVRPLPAAFYTPSANPAFGMTVAYDLVTGSRESARVMDPNGPSQAAQGISTEQKKVVAIGSREHYLVQLDMIQALQHPGNMVRMNAQLELQRQVKAFVDRFTNIRTNAVHSALIRGLIDIGSTGLIQTSTSSPVRTVSYANDTAVSITKDGSGSTYNIGDWSSASVDIVTAVKALKRFISKTYGWELTDAYYGINVPSYFALNNYIKEYLSRFEGFRNTFVGTGEIPDGMLGLNWHPVDRATSVSSGTGTSWAGDTFIAFSPPPEDNGWFENFDCSLPCPTGVTSEAELRQAMMSIDPATLESAFTCRPGIHSYTVLNTDPISAKLIVGDYSLPVVKAPNAMPRGTCA